MKQIGKSEINMTGTMLLSYLGIMTSLVTVTAMATSGILSLIASAQGKPISAEELLADPRVMGSGIGYIVAACLGVLLVMVWRGQGFLNRSFKPEGKSSMTPVRFLELLCLFMGMQTLGSTYIGIIEKSLNQLGLSAINAIEVASGGSDTFSMFLYVGLFAPFAEEILFRGGIQETLKPFGVQFSIVVTAALFGIFHGNVAQIPFAFLVGLILSAVSYKYGLKWSILLHFINNFVFAEILSKFESVQTILTIMLTLGAAGVVFLEWKSMLAWWRSLSLPEPGVWRTLFTSPTVIITVVYSLFSAVLAIGPM